MILFLGLVLTMVCAVAVSSCKGCAKSEKQDVQPVSLYHDYDGVVQDFTAGTAHIQAMHRQTIYQLVEGGEYEWRNSRVVFNEAVTYENIDHLHVTDVNDVFCYWNEQGPWVQMINSNVKKGLQIAWPIQDVWIEDDNLSDQPIKLSCEDALQRLKEWNGVLPKDCNFITLRLPVGPKECNPQWTFGDTYDVLFIDAVTGEVKDSNPAFGKPTIEKPLGEWS